MSWKIEVHRAKPNPKGKDSSASNPIPRQLLGEWVDLKNTGDTPVSLSVLHLAHTQFDSRCVAQPKPQLYWSGKAPA